MSDAAWWDREDLRDEGAERAVLGGLLSWPERAPEVAAVLDPGAFYRADHRRVYGLLLSLLDREGGFDLTTAVLAVADDPPMRALVAELPEAAPTVPTQIVKHAAALAGLAERRRIVRLGQNLANAGFRGEPTAELIETIAAAPTARAERGWGQPLDIAAALAEEPPEQRWLVRWPWGAGCLPRATVGILASDGGVGKTTALIELAVCLATGRPWLAGTAARNAMVRELPTFGLPVDRDAVGGRTLLLLAEERAGSIRRRLDAAVRAVGADPDVVARRVVLWPMGDRTDLSLTATLDGRTVPTAASAELRRQVAQRGPFDLVVLDPLSAFASAETEVSAEAATRLFAVLAALNGDDETGPTVLVAHHTTKAAAREGETGQGAIRGSSGIVNRARWAALLEEKRAKDGTRLPPVFTVVKANDAPTGRVTLARDPDARGRLFAVVDAPKSDPAEPTNGKAAPRWTAL